MAEAKQGDTVRVHYTGKLEDGIVFDSSREREPLEFTLGQQGIIPGFQKIVEGMAPGETKIEVVGSEDAYGPRQEQMVMEVGRDQLPEDLEPEAGQYLQLVKPDGQAMPVKVMDVSDESIKLDANHPLSGKDLHFEVDLIEIV
jgi:FKBP-type peptidyl-prolyl cis-trans isomerase 2